MNTYRKCSPLLIREMLIKTTIKYHFIPIRKKVLARMWRNWNLCIIGGNVKWCHCSRKWYGGSSKKLSTELPLQTIHTKK